MKHVNRLSRLDDCGPCNGQVQRPARRFLMFIASTFIMRLMTLIAVEGSGRFCMLALNGRG